MDGKKQIVEIKKGNVGSGLLLENDGYMSLDMPENKMLKESVEAFQGGMAHELPRPFVVSAVFQKYGIQNANGRIYPEKILKREVEKYQQAIKERRAFGCLNHPDSSDLDLERICLLITELHWIGHTLVGKMEIPITEGFRKDGICSNLADTLAQWLISGLRVGVSSRALGGVQQIGGTLVVDDTLELICWDAVGQPSTNNAWIEFNEKDLQPYLQENKKEKTNMLIEDKFSKFDSWLK
jgi:hypothetical protein